MSQPYKQYWKTLTPLVFLIFLAVACAPGTGQTPANDHELVGRFDAAPLQSEEIRRGALWYQLALHHHHMSVHLRLLNPAPRTSFFLPGPWAGLNDFAQDITLSGARGPDGPLPITIERNQGRIDVETDNAAWVEIHYTVQLHDQSSDRDRYRGRIHEDVFMAYAPTFLILPSDGISRTLRDIALELRIPRDWQIATTWPRVHVASSQFEADTAVHGFVIEDIRSLRDAFIAAGPTIDTHHLLVDSRNLTIAFEPGLSAAHEKITDAIHQIVSFYMDRYGARSDVTVFVTTAPEITSEALRGMGRRGGFVLELPVSAKNEATQNKETKNTEQLDDPTLILIAHEAFHMWNGHELVANPAHEQKTRWFKEGLTHYIALQSLRELGLIQEHTVLAELAKSAALYKHNLANRAKNTASALENARFPYDQGMMLALSIDAALHALTDPKFSLSDWINALLDETRAHAFHQYTENDLKRALLTSFTPAASQLNAIWVQYLEQQNPIAVAQLFKSIGLHWLNTDPQHATPRLLPLEGKPPTYLQIFSGP